MIKRSGAIVLTLLYSVTVVGFALNLHYCGNFLTAVKIDAPVKGCGKFAESKMKCCKTTHIEIKVKDAHQGKTISSLTNIIAQQLPVLAFADFSVPAKAALIEKLHYRGPPGISYGGRVAIIKNCVFRI